MTTNGDGRREFKYIGQRTRKTDAVERVTGRAVYGADMKLPGMLHAVAVRSPHPHANIVSIDSSKAEALPGVKGVITRKDLPEVGETGVTFGGELLIALEHLRVLTIAHDKALFDGHTIAVVAATSLEVAQEASELVEMEYEVLPPVENALQAMEAGAPLVLPGLIAKTLGEPPTEPSNIAMVTESGRGDVEAAFREADLVLETSYETMMVHQGYMEPQACIADVDPSGRVTVWTSTQGTFNAQRQLTALLELPQDKMNIVPLEIGGGFGGKIYTILEPLVVMLARKTGRPVKMVMSRQEVFRATGPGSPAYITVKTGTRKDGKLLACFTRMVYDAGCLPGSPTAGASIVSFGPYKVDNLRIEAFDVLTNKPRVQAYRAPGGTPAGFAVEAHMGEAATRLGIDPLEFRKLNAVEEGDLMTNDQPLNRIGLKQVLERIGEHPHWNAPLEGPNRGRGLSLGFWGGAGMTSSALVTVHPDGTVTHQSGQVDLTGTRTTHQQMVAEELQIPLENVHARVTDTDSSPYTDLSAGSRTTYTMSFATHEACGSVLEQMSAHAAAQMKVEPAEVEYEDGEFRVRENPEQHTPWREVARLSVRRNNGPVVGHGATTRQPPAPTFAAHLADVEVDPETGKVTILRYTAFQDVGKAINPQQVEGQVQGGAYQGIGWGLSEYYAYDRGVLRNPALLDYRMLTALDLPMIDTELIEVPATAGPYGARGVGEVPIVPPPAALANAIAHATGVRIRQLPMTPERVFWAIREQEGTPASAG